LTGRGRILIAVTTDTFGVGLILPISLLYFVIVSPFAVATLGVLLSLATFVSLPMGVAGGELVQRFGPKRVLVANNLCSACGYVCYYLVGVWPSKPLVFVGMLLVAVADRMFWSCWLPYLKQLSAEGGFDTWFSFIESIKAASVLSGAGLAALLLAVGGRGQVSVLVLLNIATCVASAILIGRNPIGKSTSAPATDAARQAGWGAVLRHRSYLLAALGQFLCTPIGLLGALAFPIFYVRDWHLGAWVAPTMFAVGYLMIFAGQSAMTEAIRPVHRSIQLVAACGLGVAAMVLLIAFSGTSPGPVTGTGIALAVTALLGVSALIFFPVTSISVMDMTTEENSGRVVGLFHTGTSVGIAVAPALMASLLARPATLWWVMALMNAAGMGLFQLAIRPHRSP
jgi:MFS family permease